MSQFPAALKPKEEDIAKMLACSVHIGTKNLEPAMERYVFKRRQDGVHILNLQKTWEKLVMAARVIAAIENPSDVCVVAARPYGQRSVLKFAKYIGAQAIAGRYTPGTLTNQTQDKFVEPRLLIVTDPRTDYNPIRDSSYVNIPVIGFCHTDSPLKYVDIAIPCNNKGKQAIGLMWWLLCREVLYLRGQIPRGQPWEVVVDLFLYRDPEEQEKEETTEPAFTRGPIFEEPQPADHWTLEQAPGETGATGTDSWGATGETNWDATEQ
jgi:small subunit ribosomal protein SAe